MRVSELFFKTVKEVPRDIEIKSHEFLIRGGFCFPYTSGVFGLLPLGSRVVSRIEKIVREEMQRIDGQEIRLTCLATQELWSESGRYQSIGKEMFRLNDRQDRPLVLNMTHEEPVVAMARSVLQSHRHLPAMVYQIQTKFRDEARPRGGLIRLREFQMKDAYSFHASESDLEAYYKRAHEAYERVFRRAGLINVISVQSDNGMFGGHYSHEFQLLVPSGEDKLVVCSGPNCDYRANLEVAVGHLKIKTAHTSAASEAPVPVETPGMKTIDEVAKFLNVTAQDTLKCVAFMDLSQNGVLAFVPGHREVNVSKLQVLHGKALMPASAVHLKEWGLVPGFIGPQFEQSWFEKTPLALYMDATLASLPKDTAWITGANRAPVHLKGFVIERDIPKSALGRFKFVDMLQIQSGDACQKCGSALQEKRGIEVGNIFHLGTKYSEKMEGYFLDTDGKRKPYVMGCYGIGITRMLAAVIEEHHDERGPLFPISVAPFDVHICALGGKGPEASQVQATADRLKLELESKGLEVLLDDRDEKAGSMFADADLMGVPVRVVVSAKTLAQGTQGSGELKFKTSADPKAQASMVELPKLVPAIVEWVQKEKARFAF